MRRNSKICSSFSALASAPPRIYLPAVGVSIRLRIFTSVLLPLPLGPIMLTHSPLKTSKLILSRALTSPKYLQMPSNFKISMLFP